MRRLLRLWRKDEAGTTALEFAIVAMPFVLMVFGVMVVSLYFFTIFSVENAAWQAARAIRTGQAQQAQGSYAGTVTDQDRRNIFRAALCGYMPSFLNCSSKVVVIAQSNSAFASITAPSCTTNGTLTPQSSAPFNTGSGSSVVLITVCYPWENANKLPFFRLGNLNDGALLIQASVAFRTEPYQ